MRAGGGVEVAGPGRWALAAGAAAVLWAVLVSASPASFFAVAVPSCAAWIALSARAAPARLAARLRPRAADLALGLAAGLALFAASRLFLALLCGGATDALCRPLAVMFARFPTRRPGAALVLALLVAPAEELFWRGVVQGWAATRHRPAVAVAAGVLPAAALSLATGEPLLALATLPTYAAWGALTAWRGSLVPAVVSHAAWTVLIASILPPV